MVLMAVSPCEISFVVEGDIPSMKNDLRISRNGGVFHRNNEVMTYKRLFLSQVPLAFRNKRITGPVSVDLIIYQKDRRKDAHNQMATVFDAIEHSGIIKNDRQIIKWSGCRQIDKDYPRVQLKVMEMGEGNV
jgi:Holliday junction resolvase RusA-like endonuclease